MALVKVLKSWLEEPTEKRGVLVNDVFALVRLDGSWQIVHRASGVRTHYLKRSKTDCEASALAAAKRFKRELRITEPRQLIDALRKAGSESWSKNWWKRREKAKP